MYTVCENKFQWNRKLIYVSFMFYWKNKWTEIDSFDTIEKKFNEGNV